MNQQNKTLFIATIALIFVAAIAFYAARPSFMISGQANLQENSSDRADVYSSADRAAFEAFLRENLSDLSPEKEVLGGTFYLTTLEWETDREAYIAYEDGHIALEARVGFSVVGLDNGAVQVDYFNIITDDQAGDGREIVE